MVVHTRLWHLTVAGDLASIHVLIVQAPSRVIVDTALLILQDSILDELDKEDSTHDSVSQESESDEDGVRVDSQKALVLKEKVL